MSENSPEALIYDEEIPEEISQKKPTDPELLSGEDSGQVTVSDSQSEGETGNDSDQNSDGETDQSSSPSSKESEPKEIENAWTRGLKLAKEKLLKSKQNRIMTIASNNGTVPKDLKMRAPVKKTFFGSVEDESFSEFGDFQSNNPLLDDYYQYAKIGYAPNTWKRILPADLVDPSMKRIKTWRKQAKKRAGNRRGRYSSASSNSQSDSDSSNDSDEKVSKGDAGESCPSPASSSSSGLSSLAGSFLNFPFAPEKTTGRKLRSNSRKRGSSSSRSSSRSSGESSVSSMQNQRRKVDDRNTRPYNQRANVAGQFKDYNSWKTNQTRGPMRNRNTYRDDRPMNNNYRGGGNGTRNLYDRNRYTNNNNNANNQNVNKNRYGNRRYSPSANNGNNDRFHRTNNDHRRNQPNRPPPPTYGSSRSSSSSPVRSRKVNNYRDRSPYDRNTGNGRPQQRYNRKFDASKSPHRKSSSSASSRSASSKSSRRNSDHPLAPLLAGSVNPSSGPHMKISMNDKHLSAKRRLPRSRSSSSSMSEPTNKRMNQSSVKGGRKRYDSSSSSSSVSSVASYKNANPLIHGVNPERRSPPPSMHSNHSGDPSGSVSNENRLKELRERLTMVNDAIAEITANK